MSRLAATSFVLLLALMQTVFAQKREFRAAWIATVSNIDWPSQPGLPADEQRSEFIARLDELKKLGCNAIIVQVRPASDAFYASAKEPWSRYLTGKQGEPPVPYYDPLDFMIAETHKRNMEFHAWFNPFRALVDSRVNPNPADHITRKRPEWIIHYGGKSYLDPGLPQTRSYVIDVILDVVTRYDIDGVHLDDYFYPYRVAGKVFGDGKSYTKYGDSLSRDEWRRQNVNKFIAELNWEIKQKKRYVKFGVSPFGVWRNGSKDPEGSPTTAGTTCFDDLYSDVLLWMRNGWVDYLMPQLYWEHGHRAAAFDALLPWWQAHTYKRHMYYGLGVYRMWESPKGAWKTGEELLWQIRDIRMACTEGGCCFYSASSFGKAKGSVRDSLTSVYNKHVALPPVMKWIDSIAPAAPLLRAESSATGTKLSWGISNPAKEPLKYAVYRFTANEVQDISRPNNLIAIVQQTNFTDTSSTASAKRTYVVTSLDRLWNESRASNSVEVTRP